MSSNNVKNLVPILDGLNWLAWKNQMTAYLHWKGLWQIVDGFDSFPPSLLGKKRHVQAADGTTSKVIDPPSAELVEASQAKQLEWLNRDDQVQGIIMFWISQSLKQHLGDKAKTTWANLKEAFSKQTPSSIFNDFQKLINLRITGNCHPSADMDNMWDIFERLKANNVDFPKLICAFLLLNVLPTPLQSIATIQLQTEAKDDLDFQEIRQHVLTEYERKGNMTANKLSAVKRKGPDPNYQQQKKKQNSSAPAPEVPNGSSEQKGKEKARCLKRGGKKWKQKQLEEEQSHSHLGSFAHIVEVPEECPIIVSQPSCAGPSNTTIASFNKDKITFRQVKVNAPMVKTTEKSIFPTVQTAQDNCEHLCLPKTATKLATFEKIAVASSSKTLDQRISEPLPAANWDLEEEVSYGWDDDVDVDMEIADAAGLKFGFLMISKYFLIAHNALS